MLLGLLEPESARRYEDPLLAVPPDLSSVKWVLTANSTDTLPGAVHGVLAEAFAADGGMLRRIRLGLRGALGPAALAGDPVAAARDALGPETAIAIGFHRAATPAR
ncbi:hypothetical protein [Falsiroseomonas sp. E2-1-a4]|uniref:hypothetical protein n=1 Tax=Falsiroseomonas sp. E2-1-a4 TaxID=3239299 RepID=UPI003F2DDC80